MQRLLVIANKIHNTKLADWIVKELNGYDANDRIPEYRKTSSRNIIYSGINGAYQITNQPLAPGYLNEETIEKVKDFSIFESIYDVEERKKLGKETPQLYRDLTGLAGEVYQNTKDEATGIGVQCTSIRQVISSEVYSRVYASVKTRVINTLCAFEEAGVDIDAADVENAKRSVDFDAQNFEMYQTVIVDGKTYAYIFQRKEHKAIWQILIPIIINLITALVTFLLTYFLAPSK